MRASIQEAFSKFSGQDVFVIGGGPSVAAIDPKVLDGKLIVCINTAYKLFPNASMLYWCDESWIGNNLTEINNHSCKLRFTSKHHADHFVLKDLPTTGDAHVLKRTGDYGYDNNIDHVYGNNSGTQVLNFLINLKVDRIFLLGFEMHMDNGKSHWHKFHTLPMLPHIYTNQFIPSMNGLSNCSHSYNTKIINCTPNTALNCFTKGNLADFVK